ncbi:MAG: hypothetical protein KDK63_01795 [Chlamydiia bacterium]|nr:hypothetical protein [Chlamydiia bacterium]MCB1116195.1 hypothetical protein [Chlamydiia bacterium]
MEDEFFQEVKEAHKRASRKAFETAVRTNTALIYEKDGKIIEYRPPYRYKLVPIDPETEPTPE